jgi:hypothetical protein
MVVVVSACRRVSPGCPGQGDVVRCHCIHSKNGMSLPQRHSENVVVIAPG